MSGKWQWLLFILVFLLAVGVRLLAYSHFDYSLATIDTASYLQASEVKFPSVAFFSSPRSATIPLLYKLLRPAQGYHLDLIANPAGEGGAHLPGDQGDFRTVVKIQVAISILAWGSLALVFFRHLQNPIVKTLAAAAILFFGFSPQMADWDTLLMSESLSFSFYALLVALAIELAFSLRRGRDSSRWKPYIWVALLILVTAVWTFTRDTNAYLLLFSIACLLVLILIAFWRKILPVGPLALLGGALLVIFWFQQATFHASIRWLLPFLNNMTANVFPYPGRVQFFASHGMPVTPQLVSLRGSAEDNGIYDQKEFIAWAQKDGLDTYTQFLVRTPIWAFQTFYTDLESLFGLNQQWYFGQNYRGHPAWLIPLGNILHPASSGVLLITILLALLVFGLVYQDRSSRSIAWGVVVAWLLLNGLVLLLAGYFGEVRSVARHSLAGTVPLRLALWMFLAIVADLSLSREKPSQAEK